MMQMIDARNMLDRALEHRDATGSPELYDPLTETTIEAIVAYGQITYVVNGIPMTHIVS